jgi:hypothetical protein
MSKKMGRPRLAKGMARGKIIAARFSPSETKEIETAVKRSGKKSPDWVRASLLTSARSKSE